MALQDHVAIILSCSLDRASKNRKKPTAPPRYYVRAALPPAADGDLGEAMAQVAPGGNWQATSHNIRANSMLKKPYPGVPDDWRIVKFDTQYPVPLYAPDGSEIFVSAENSARIRSEFYAGQRARIEGSPYLWNNDGETGISWNLWGVMAVGGGDRLPGSGGSGFAAYRPQGAGAAPQQSGGFGTNTPADGGQQQQQSGGFGAPAQGAPAGAAGTNPFQQPANAGNGNPFAG